MARQLASSRAWLSICSAHRFGASSVGSLPSSASNESAREWAGSVDITRVRCPSWAARAAVAAATVVLPTPPLPVNNRIRNDAPTGSRPMCAPPSGVRIPLGSAAYAERTCPTKDRKRSAGSSGAFDPALQVVQRGSHDLPGGLPLDQPGQGHAELDVEAVGDPGGVLAVERLQLVGAAQVLEGALAVGPRHPARAGGVPVGQGVLRRQHWRAQA